MIILMRGVDIMVDHKILQSIIEQEPGLEFRQVMERLREFDTESSINIVRNQLNSMVKFRMINKRYGPSRKSTGVAKVLKYYPRED